MGGLLLRFEDERAAVTGVFGGFNLDDGAFADLAGNHELGEGIHALR